MRVPHATRLPFLVKLLVLLSACLLATGGSASALTEHLWSLGYDAEGLADVGGDGNVLSAGTFTSPIDFGGGVFDPLNIFGGDVFIASFDADGNHRWSTAFPSNGFLGCIVSGVAADENGSLYVVGTLRDGVMDFGGGPISGFNEIFLAAFDSGGNHLWSKTCGVGTPRGIDARNGRVSVIGFTAASVDFGGGPISSVGHDDIFLATLDSSGNHIWSTGFGDAEGQVGNNVVLDETGGLVMACSMRGTVDYGGGPLTADDIDLCLVRFDAAGGHIWSRIFAGDFSNAYIVESALALGQDRIALVGQLNADLNFGGGTIDGDPLGNAFAVVFDGDANHVWSGAWGNSNTQMGRGAAFDSAGNLTISGIFAGEMLIGGLLIANIYVELFAARFDPEGVPVWAQNFASGTHNQQCFVASSPDDSVLLYGDAAPGIDFGGGSLAEGDFFLAYLGDPGTPAPVTPFGSAGLRNHPNPFNPKTSLSFELQSPGSASLEIYDTAGRRVRTLMRGELAAGEHHVQWDGRNDRGAALPSGIYLARLQSGTFRESRRLTLIK